jgi:hypothetical protein
LVARHSLLPLEEGGLGLPRVVVRAARSNIASQRVALNAGFRPAGVDRAGEILRDGSVQDLLRFDLLPQELRVPPQRSPERLLRTPDAPPTPPRLELPDRRSKVLDLDTLREAEHAAADAGRDPGRSRSVGTRVGSGGPGHGSTGGIPIVGNRLGPRTSAPQVGTPGEPGDGVTAGPAPRLGGPVSGPTQEHPATDGPGESVPVARTGDGPGGDQGQPARGRWARAARHRH